MAFQRVKLSAELQAELKELAARLGGCCMGKRGAPSGGRNSGNRAAGLSAGMEFARLVMEQTVAEQTQRMPASALEAPETKFRWPERRRRRWRPGRGGELGGTASDVEARPEGFFFPPASVGIESR